MEHKFPTWCLIVSILFMFAFAFGVTIDVGVALARLVLVFAVLCIPVIIGKSRNVIKQNLVVQWALLLWFIPFSWIIAMSIALFGKTEQNAQLIRKEKQSHRDSSNIKGITYNNKITYNYQYPENAIDKTFYKLGHATTGVITTIRDSKVVRGTVSVFFKMILLAIILFFVGVLLIINEKTQQTQIRRITPQINNQVQYKSQIQEQQINKKLREQEWFKQAAANMR